MTIKEICRRVQELTHNPLLLRISRQDDKAFTRKRSMSFSDALCFMLDMCKTTLQTRLNKFYALKKEGEPISQPAFTQLRAKFDHKAFEFMVHDFVAEEYSGRYELPTWNDFHILAVDGSYLQLPTDAKLAAEFGVRGGGNRPSAGISVLYDVLHGWVLDAEIDHTDRNERFACARHVDFLANVLPDIVKRSILLLDRGYPSHDLLQKIDKNGLKFVARCSSESFSAANNAPMGDSIATLKNGQTVRIVKFILNSGEIETLVTNLFDLPEVDFPALYAMRWGVETMYHRLKREICIEKFSGKSPNSIRQDFWASLVILITVAVAQKEADSIVQKRQNPKQVKHLSRARTSDLIVTLRDHFIFSTLASQSEHTLWALDNIIKLLARTTSPVRPGRSFPRIPKPCAAANQNLKSHL